MKPKYKKNLTRVLYGIPLGMVTITMTLLSVAVGVAMQEWRYFLGMACAGILLIVFFPMYLWISYALGAWIFRKAVQWAGGSLSDQKSRDLYFYLAAFSILIFILVGLFSIIITPSFTQQGITGKYRSGLSYVSIGKGILSPTMLIPALFIMYVQYKIIDKTTNINGLAVIVLQWIIAWLLRLAFSLLLSIILRSMYYFFLQDIMSTLDQPYMQNALS